MIRVQSWRAAYAGLIAPEMLAAMDIDRESERRARLWSEYHADRRSAEFLAEVDGEPVGWASIGPARDDDTAGNGELYAVYALPRLWSHGVGHALLAHAEEALRTHGFARALLWVLAGNDRAASFYERHGWREDGTSKDQAMGDFVLRERRRVRDLHETAHPDRPHPTA